MEDPSQRQLAEVPGQVRARVLERTRVALGMSRSAAEARPHFADVSALGDPTSRDGLRAFVGRLVSEQNLLASRAGVDAAAAIAALAEGVQKGLSDCFEECDPTNPHGEAEFALLAQILGELQRKIVFAGGRSD